MKEIVIDSVVYAPKAEKNMSCYSLIRTYSAGVHFGIVKKREGKEVVLNDARRIWYWEGAFTLSAIAVDGVSKPDRCKFSCAVPEIALTEAIEIILCTERAAKIILGVPVWEKK